MEQNEYIFKHLSEVRDPEKVRLDLASHIKSQLPRFQTVSDDTFDAAYQLAGLMATDYVRTLLDGDSLLEILALAGELETRPPDSKELAREIAAQIAAL